MVKYRHSAMQNLSWIVENLSPTHPTLEATGRCILPKQDSKPREKRILDSENRGPNTEERKEKVLEWQWRAISAMVIVQWVQRANNLGQG